MYLYTYDVTNNHEAATYHYTGRLLLASTGRYWPILAAPPRDPLLTPSLLPLYDFATALISLVQVARQPNWRVSRNESCG